MPQRRAPRTSRIVPLTGERALFRNGEPFVLGATSAPDEAEVHLDNIPDDKSSIRLWARGMTSQGGYFFNAAEGVPVDTPDGYVLSAISTPGLATFGSLCPDMRSQ
ncbi:hypothetical protein GLOTRDRAFT_123956 [Gloeophyllum trabeum ATCC 11539]|uniref:Uncharacterized protein n=1 Tax=Gloeophyllum trabeum (strain ATCC 11539 / FP-39264 / Madison 617) TaxID=670483 RepID=S7S305_GLOTA|nr:uncharacterized protein GLOTRDRAFT_123956 [Gloeophyllum trabeum ATCC 11539]EPQ60199.1 hypothetical protein GLOTRDRAFT_123956 [Gloeophyllum trabeum ATCC 11539]